jgi:hypothetical protein
MQKVVMWEQNTVICFVFIDNRYSTGFHTIEENVKHECEVEGQKLVCVCLCVCSFALLLSLHVMPHEVISA